jgi:hypothetical protein
MRLWLPPARLSPAARPRRRVRPRRGVQSRRPGRTRACRPILRLHREGTPAPVRWFGQSLAELGRRRLDSFLAQGSDDLTHQRRIVISSADRLSGRRDGGRGPCPVGAVLIQPAYYHKVCSTGQTTTSLQVACSRIRAEQIAMAARSGTLTRAGARRNPCASQAWQRGLEDPMMFIPRRFGVSFVSHKGRLRLGVRKDSGWVWATHRGSRGREPSRPSSEDRDLVRG